MRVRTCFIDEIALALNALTHCCPILLPVDSITTKKLSFITAKIHNKTGIWRNTIVIILKMRKKASWFPHTSDHLICVKL